jgi:hypothetical protein
MPGREFEEAVFLPTHPFTIAIEPENKIWAVPPPLPFGRSGSGYSLIYAISRRACPAANCVYERIALTDTQYFSYLGNMQNIETLCIAGTSKPYTLKVYDVIAV